MCGSVGCDFCAPGRNLLGKRHKETVLVLRSCARGVPSAFVVFKASVSTYNYLNPHRFAKCETEISKTVSLITRVREIETGSWSGVAARRKMNEGNLHLIRQKWPIIGFNG